MPQRRTIHFSGQVQGVGFRATALHLAHGAPLAGSVENLPDGRVKLVLEGETAEIDALVARLREQFDGLIRTVLQETAPATGTLGSGVCVIH